MTKPNPHSGSQKNGSVLPNHVDALLTYTNRLLDLLSADDDSQRPAPGYRSSANRRGKSHRH